MGHPKFLAHELVPCGLRGPDKSLITKQKGSLCLEGFLPPCVWAAEKMGLSFALSDVTFSLPLGVMICYCEKQKKLAKQAVFLGEFSLVEIS